MDPGEKFVKAFQQILFAQFRGLGDPLLVLESSTKTKRGQWNAGALSVRNRLRRAVSPRSNREKRMLVSTTILAGFTRPPRG